MLSTDGRLFHIDFGHFLGNIKRKFGIKRERTPFILTSDFVSVMEWEKNPGKSLEGKDESKVFPFFDKFLEASSKAFLIIRQNAHLFLNLLTLVISNVLFQAFLIFLKKKKLFFFLDGFI